ncbi:MAG: alpha/beta fold hydrolase [Planctomycetaceae bacterium]
MSTSRDWLGPLAIAVVVLLAVGLQVDVADDSALIFDGPGLTLDEGFNVEVGVYLVQSSLQYGVAIVDPTSLKEIFGDPSYNPDHPPLGRWAIGITEQLGRTILGARPGPPMYVITYGRLAPALAFALNVFVVGWFVTKWNGPRAGCFAALALALMPRAFGHAHFASLETFMGLTYSTVLLVTADQWKPSATPTWRSSALIGLLLGLAFLTKIQAIFLPPMLLLWGLWNWRQKAIGPLLLLGAVTAIVFFVGWPWLWLDPAHHLREYFARTTERQVVYCHYLGQHLADRDVPWHYSTVMFLWTMPVTLLGAGLLGCAGFRIDQTAGSESSASFTTASRWQLLMMGWLGPIIFFALPGIALYDGIRLFLVSLPVFAVFCGCGLDQLLEITTRRWSPKAVRALIGAALAIPLIQIIFLAPCWLSFYSEATGGLAGANRLGAELSYWGDSQTPQFMREVVEQLPEGATLDVAPVLHPAQLEFFVRNQTQLRLRPDVKLRGYDPSLHSDLQYVLTFRRLADPWKSLDPPPPGTKTLAQVVREGVLLAAFYELPQEDIEPDDVTPQVILEPESTPTPKSDTSEAALPTIDELLLFFPSKYPAGNWKPANLSYEDVTFNAEDGTTIHGWYCSCDNPRATLLYAHGNGGNLTYRTPLLEYLTKQLRVNVLIFDYRGYGRSEGVPTVEGALEDARAARTFLAQHEGIRETDIVLMGRSLGGAIVVQLATEKAPRGLVLESTFSSLKDIATVHYPKLAWLVPAEKLNSAKRITQYHGPLLQSHGDADYVIPFASGQKLFDAALDPKQFVTINGTGHNDPQSPEYYRRLDQFIESLP